MDSQLGAGAPAWVVAVSLGVLCGPPYLHARNQGPHGPAQSPWPWGSNPQEPQGAGLGGSQGLWSGVQSRAPFRAILEGAPPTKCHPEAPLHPLRAPGSPLQGFKGCQVGRSRGLRTLQGWADTWSFSTSCPGGPALTRVQAQGQRVNASAQPLGIPLPGQSQGARLPGRQGPSGR